MMHPGLFEVPKARRSSAFLDELNKLGKNHEQQVAALRRRLDSNNLKTKIEALDDVFVSGFDETFSILTEQLRKEKNTKFASSIIDVMIESWRNTSLGDFLNSIPALVKKIENNRLRKKALSAVCEFMPFLFGREFGGEISGQLPSLVKLLDFKDTMPAKVNFYAPRDDPKSISHWECSRKDSVACMAAHIIGNSDDLVYARILYKKGIAIERKPEDANGKRLIAHLADAILAIGDNFLQSKTQQDLANIDPKIYAWAPTVLQWAVKHKSE